jgi:hypothetical protein
MQIFYYGPAISPGFSFMSFTPAFHNQTEVRLNEPPLGEFVEGSYSRIASVSSNNDPEPNFDDPKYKAAAKARQEKAKQEFNKQVKVIEERSQKMRDSLMKALNDATAEGWEVVKMSSYTNSGLAYLLRRAK